MKTTAAGFKQKPHDIYQAASKGETVIINHDRYRDVVFELVARPRGSETESEEGRKYLGMSEEDAQAIFNKPLSNEGGNRTWIKQAIDGRQFDE